MCNKLFTLIIYLMIVMSVANAANEVTEADIDAFFGERNAYCDAFNAQVQEEFDAIDMTE